MSDSRERVLRQLWRTGEELFALAAAIVDALAEHALADWHAALRSEAERWHARAHADPAAARVAELFDALAEVFAEASRRPAEPGANSARPTRRDTPRRFDPPPGRWDTPARWRS